MLSNLKIVINKQIEIKKINTIISYINTSFKKNKRPLDPEQKETLYKNIKIARNLKYKDLEKTLFDVFSNCPILGRLIPEKFKDDWIYFDLNKACIYNSKNQIICAFNSNHVIYDVFSDVHKSVHDICMATCYYTVPSDHIEARLNYETLENSCDKYYNNVYDFHMKIYDVENIYNDIANRFNINIMPSFYSGWVKGNDIEKVDGEFITEFNNNENPKYFTLTLQNIDKHLSFDDALEFLYINNVYSPLNISSFKSYKQHLKSIKKYTGAIKKIFTLYNEDLEQINNPHCFVSFKAADKDFENIIDGEFIFQVKDFIDDETIEISVTSLDIAYCNTDKILEHYYSYNKKLKNLIEKDTFLEHTLESLKVLYMSHY